MKIFALVFLLFTLTAQAEIFICNTQELGSGFEIEIETQFNHPIARYRVSQWSSAPPPAGGQRVILDGRGELEVVQKIPRLGMKGPQEDYTKWIITSPDLSVDFTHYGIAHSFGKIAVSGDGLPGNFALPSKNILRNIRCLKRR